MIVSCESLGGCATRRAPVGFADEEALGGECLGGAQLAGQPAKKALLISNI